MIRPPRSCPNLKIHAIVGLALLLFADVQAGAPEPAQVGVPWKTTGPVPIAVDRGQARFDIPTPQPDSRALVIVSALARPRGPFPIRLTAQPTDETKPIRRFDGATKNSPLIGTHKPLTIPPPTTLIPPDRRTFALLANGGDVAAASSYLAVEGRLVTFGRRIQVYLDVRDTGAVDPATVHDLVSTFDDRIFPEAARRFGPATDVDRDGRFTVLFTSWLGRLAGGKVSVDGFVRGADLDLDLGQPFGNRCDMMYLGTNLKSGPHLRTIVAHEYTHAVTFSRKALAKGSGGLEEEGWLDEALAHLVEDSHGFSMSNIDFRVSAFLSRPESYRLVVDDYYAADLFRSHGNRGACYLFLRWCVDRYGPGLVDALIRSDRRGVANLEAATGTSFAELFRQWTVSLYLSGLDPSTAHEGAYRSIDPRGELEDWILAGPRVSSVGPSGGVDSWVAQGTTTHYVIIEGSPTSKGVRVEVNGPPDAEIQVTAIPLPAGLGRPELKVRREKNAGGQIQVRAEVSERDGTPIRLGALAWEPLVPAEDPRKPVTRRGGLDMLGIARVFGTSALPARGVLRSRSIPLAGFGGAEGPIVFKAVGTDARGRRVAAWTVVNFSEVEPVPNGSTGPL